MDWAARIKRAERKGKFTAIDKRLAWPWLTCAVGEKTYIKGRKEADAEPYNGLNELGGDFASAVSFDDIEAAKEVYQQIQDYKE